MTGMRTLSMPTVRLICSVKSMGSIHRHMTSVTLRISLRGWSRRKCGRSCRRPVTQQIRSLPGMAKVFEQNRMSQRQQEQAGQRQEGEQNRENGPERESGQNWTHMQGREPGQPRGNWQRREAAQER